MRQLLQSATKQTARRRATNKPASFNFRSLRRTVEGKKSRLLPSNAESFSKHSLLYLNLTPRGFGQYSKHPQSNPSASAAFAADIKFYRTINNPGDGESLEQDLKQVCDWCKMWRMDLNNCKCCLLSLARNSNPYCPSYHLDDIEVKKTDVHKDRGVLVSFDLEWTSHVRSVTAKANKIRGYLGVNCQFWR